MSFTTYNTAARTREAIRKIAKQVYFELNPPQRWATVTAIDRQARTVTVEYPDEVGTTSIVPCRALMPNHVGQTVRVGGPVGRRYVTEIIGLGSTHEWSIGLPYAANWSDLGGLQWGIGTYQRINSRVYLDGMVRRDNTATTGTHTVCTLPAGYRPVFDHILYCWSSIGPARIEILNTGVLRWHTNNGVLNVGNSFSLTGMSFPIYNQGD